MSRATNGNSCVTIKFLTVLEYRVDFGPGYRVYFGKDGHTIVILLGDGTKKRQDRDIADAHGRWLDYKERKSQET
jgi:putative addiction module killer protein